MSSDINSCLKEVNQIYLEMEQILGSQTEFEIQQDPGKRIRYFELFDEAINKFNALAPTCTPEEIIEAYNNGTENLHRNAAGLMSSEGEFNHAYIPVMKKAIKDDILDNIYHFLYALKRHLPKEELETFLALALKSKYQGVKRASISIVEELKIERFLPELIVLKQDLDENVAAAASRAVTIFRGYKKP